MAQAPDFDTMNETDVREILVRPLIDQLGYRHGTEATVITEKTLRYEKAFLGRKTPKKILRSLAVLTTFVRLSDMGGGWSK